MKYWKLLLVVLTLLMQQLVFAAQPSHVVIERLEDQSSTQFISVPKHLPAENLRQLSEYIAKDSRMSLVTWAEFKSDLAKHVSAHIRRNDYPEVDVAAGLIRLLERYDSTPFGLTWNGGLAITGNDYRRAKLTYEGYVKDPNSVAREPDSNRDPVHPDNHLGPLMRR